MSTSKSREQNQRGQCGLPRAELTILSMGWGRQTWTMAAMMALGELPRVDVIVHADTSYEHQATYEFRRQWEPWLTAHGLPVVSVQGKRVDVVREDWGTGAVMIPAFAVNAHTGSQGQVRRQCTSDWKIAPIRAWVWAELKLRDIKRRPGVVEMQMGISYDEWQRMRTSDVQYITNAYPLVERRLGISDCLAWLTAHELPTPPKSACVFCPYNGLRRWRDLKRIGGPDWEQAVQVDTNIRDRRPQHGPLYLHPHRRPLTEAVSIPEDEGATQMGFEALCDGGFCGV